MAAHLVRGHLLRNGLVNQALHLRRGHLRLHILGDHLLHDVRLHLLLHHVVQQRLGIPGSQLLFRFRINHLLHGIAVHLRFHFACHRSLHGFAGHLLLHGTFYLLLDAIGGHLFIHQCLNLFFTHVGDRTADLLFSRCLRLGANLLLSRRFRLSPNGRIANLLLSLAVNQCLGVACVHLCFCLSTDGALHRFRAHLCFCLGIDLSLHVSRGHAGGHQCVDFFLCGFCSALSQFGLYLRAYLPLHGSSNLLPHLGANLSLDLCTYLRTDSRLHLRTNFAGQLGINLRLHFLRSKLLCHRRIDLILHLRGLHLLRYLGVYGLLAGVAHLSLYLLPCLLLHSGTHLFLGCGLHLCRYLFPCRRFHLGANLSFAPGKHLLLHLLPSSRRDLLCYLSPRRLLHRRRHLPLGRCVHGRGQLLFGILLHIVIHLVQQFRLKASDFFIIVLNGEVFDFNIQLRELICFLLQGCIGRFKGCLYQLSCSIHQFLIMCRQFVGTIQQGLGTIVQLKPCVNDLVRFLCQLILIHRQGQGQLHPVDGNGVHFEIRCISGDGQGLFRIGQHNIADLPTGAHVHLRCTVGHNVPAPIRIQRCTDLQGMAAEQIPRIVLILPYVQLNHHVPCLPCQLLHRHGFPVQLIGQGKHPGQIFRVQISLIVDPLGITVKGDFSVLEGNRILRIQGMHGSVIPVILNVSPFENVHYIHAVHLPLCIQHGVHHFLLFRGKGRHRRPQHGDSQQQ